jgi:predicted lipid-binding transport protein (Tim44 family)
MDIIFFAAIAFYIFFKFSKELGKIDEDEKKRIEEKLFQKSSSFFGQKKESAENSQQIIEIKNQAEEKILENLSQEVRQNFLTILRSVNITAEFFINGAKSAFEIVVKSFAEEDLQSLKFLLSDKIFEGFQFAINERKSKNQKLISNIISIEKSEINSAMMIGNIASISVKFTTKQINYIINEQNQIIEGSKDLVVQLNDIWTFKKDITNQDPNWLIISTNFS